MCIKQAGGDPYWALAHQTTQNGTFIDDKWSSQVWKYGEISDSIS